MKKKMEVDLNSFPLPSDDEQDQVFCAWGFYLHVLPENDKQQPPFLVKSSLQETEKHCTAQVSIDSLGRFPSKSQLAINLNIASTSETEVCPVAPIVIDEFRDGNKLNENLMSSPAQTSHLKFPHQVYKRSFPAGSAPRYNRQLRAIVPGPKLKGSMSRAPFDELQQPSDPPSQHQQQETSKSVKQKKDTGDLSLQNLNSVRGFRYIMPKGRIQKLCVHSDNPKGCPYQPNCPYFHENDMPQGQGPTSEVVEVSSSRTGKERKLSELMESTKEQKGKFTVQSKEGLGDHVIGSKRGTSMLHSEQEQCGSSVDYSELVVEKFKAIRKRAREKACEF